MNPRVGRLRLIGRRINFAFNESRNKWIWQEIVDYEVTKEDLHADLIGSQGEIDRLEELEKYWQKRLTEVDNDVDFIGARDELTRIRSLLQEERAKLRGIQQALGRVIGPRNPDIPNRDNPSRGDTPN